MKTRHFLLSGLMILALCQACNNGPSRDEMVDDLRVQDSIFTSNSNKMAIDNIEAQKMVDGYMQFADKFPQDSLSPLFLHKAGDIYSQIGNCDNALQLYDRIIEKYPEYQNIEDVFFNRGWTLESAQRYPEAREAFKDYLERCPNHPLANDIRYMLEQNLIGLSAEEQYEAIVGKQQ